MEHVIESNGVLVETEVKLPITFRDARLESDLRLDLLGYLINFNVPHLKDGIKRMIV